jgi:hypothetical protein
VNTRLTIRRRRPGVMNLRSRRIRTGPANHRGIRRRRSHPRGNTRRSNRRSNRTLLVSLRASSRRGSSRPDNSHPDNSHQAGNIRQRRRLRPRRTRRANNRRGSIRRGSSPQVNIRRRGNIRRHRQRCRRRTRRASNRRVNSHPVNRRVDSTLPGSRLPVRILRRNRRRHIPPASSRRVSHRPGSTRRRNHRRVRTRQHRHHIRRGHSPRPGNMSRVPAIRSRRRRRRRAPIRAIKAVRTDRRISGPSVVPTTAIVAVISRTRHGPGMRATIPAFVQHRPHAGSPGPN